MIERERDGWIVCYDKCFRDGNNFFFVRNVIVMFYRINFDFFEIFWLGDFKFFSLFC